ncbi:MAG: hypothetical protein C0394_06770 [Syntrophus sp. (in: bacteria)]|nr:hypothetical protein [Syntrophus sp. (in: bacteria)]
MDRRDACPTDGDACPTGGHFHIKVLSSIIMASKEPPDLILPDIIMPELSGGHVAEQLLENPATADIPVLFITAIASRTQVQSQLGKIGGRSFIAKPVTPEELMGKIDRLFTRKQ